MSPLRSFAPPAILDAYEAERQPITEQVSRLVMGMALKIMKQRREMPAEIEWPGAIGDAMRARIGKEAYDIDVELQCCTGLNFGYFYERSPIIAYDGEQQPAYTMSDSHHLRFPDAVRCTYGSLIIAPSTTRLMPDTRLFGSIRVCASRA
jgi:hypothetical protein